VKDATGTRQNGIVGVFNRAAATYDRIGPRFFTHFGQRLVDLTQVAPGAQVLDVAAGRGAVLFPVATRVGPRGRVVGTDLSTDMVRETAADIERAGWQQARMQQMDAQALQFPAAAFDCVLCGFALWYLPQPHHALREFHRVLKPGGRLGLSTWADDCPFLLWCLRELTAALPPQSPPAAGGQEEPRFDTPARLETALRQAGFGDIQVRSDEADFVYAQDEEWWLSLWSHGARALLERLEPTTLAQVKTRLLHQAQALKQPDGIHTRFRALYAFGTKPVAGSR